MKKVVLLIATLPRRTASVAEPAADAPSATSQQRRRLLTGAVVSAAIAVAALSGVPPLVHAMAATQTPATAAHDHD